MQEALKLSVIIPCWNDVAALKTLLPALRHLSGISEVIVADASRIAECREVVERFNAKMVECSTPNRGAQMNAGAAGAIGDILLFHHADSVLNQAHVDSIFHAFGENPDFAGGAFYRKFDARHPYLRWLEFWARLLTRRGGTLYGDQSMFVRRDHFETLHGFAEIPLMEDVEFSRRLRRSGKVIILDPPIYSSPRRHVKNGAWKMTLQNGLFILLFKLGASPQKLHGWYYRYPPV